MALRKRADGQGRVSEKPSRNRCSLAWLLCPRHSAPSASSSLRLAAEAASPELHGSKDGQPSCAPDTKPTRGCTLSSLGMASGAPDRTLSSAPSSEPPKLKKESNPTTLLLNGHDPPSAKLLAYTQTPKMWHDVTQGHSVHSEPPTDNGRHNLRSPLRLRGQED